MFVESIRSIRFKIIFIGLNIIGYQIGTITSFENLTTNETFYVHDRTLIKSNLNVISRLHGTQLRLRREIKVHKFFDKKISISIDNKSLFRKFKGVQFYNGNKFKILFNSAHKLYFLVYISIEIDGRTFKPNFFSILSHQ